MHLGIRRKLIGTLVLVGLLPMMLSLLTILGIGARDRIDTVQNAYVELAAACAHAVSFQFEAEVRRVNLAATLPEVVHFIQQHNDIRRPALVPPANRPAAHQSARMTGPRTTLQELLNNPIARRIRLLTADKMGLYHVMVINRHGIVIAADVRPAVLNVRHQWWWKIADSGIGGTCVIGSVFSDPVTGQPIIPIIVPVVAPASGVLVGFMEETINVAALTYEMRLYLPQARAVAQVYDQKIGRSIFILGNPVKARRGRQRFMTLHHGHQPGWIGDLLSGNLIGDAPVKFSRMSEIVRHPVVVPHWTIILSQSSHDVLVPILRQAQLVAAAGGLLILGIFALGYVFSKREIIYPILRLREATSAVGRGELNIRLLSENAPDPTFRGDELGELARDFDEMTRRLAANVRKFEQTDKAKQRFMDLAAHELRSPISHIVTTAQLTQRQLANSGLPRPAPGDTANVPAKEIYKSLDSILKNARRLSKIVTDLLKLVQEDVFTTKPRRDPFDLRALILEVCDQQSGFITARRQQLEVTVPDSIPTMRGDADKISDILTNLLSNAIRFSPDGAVVRVMANVLLASRVELIVEDSGSGMPDDVIAAPFQPFQTGADPMQHHSGDATEEGSRGLGLGLAIVRRFVELHAGEIFIRPLPTGTQVRVILPLDPDADTPTDKV
ncbi:MAG: HAMP domain-containing sensor histidine kinase [Planctomycetia bacterium]|nr:HAMP domain-containing sensor histidine kinase [Planctomycetia bacterium]